MKGQRRANYAAYQPDPSTTALTHHIRPSVFPCSWPDGLELLPRGLVALYKFTYLRHHFLEHRPDVNVISS